jgi:hypothetical protein
MLRYMSPEVAPSGRPDMSARLFAKRTARQFRADGVPAGQISSLSVSEPTPFVQASNQRYLSFAFSEFMIYSRPFRCRHKGRTRRHERGAECDGRKGAD